QEEMDAIMYDAREGDLEFLKEVFTEMIPGLLLPTIKDKITLSTPVHMAAGNGHLETLAFLLSLVDHDTAVALANTPNETGNTPLHWACYGGHLKTVKFLVEKHGADVYAKNSSLHDALFEAESNGKTEVENWLLLKFAVEEEVSIDESGEVTKITYTPGKESYAVDK
ncbi:ankyrin, partial [Metschnikowia bicuspidata]